MISIFFYFSNFKTSFGQTSAHLSQYVQPLFVKSNLGVESSWIIIIFSSQTVPHNPYAIYTVCQKNWSSSFIE